MSNISTPPAQQNTGRLLLWLGFALPFLGLGAFSVQFLAHRFFVPWYLPSVCLIGELLIVAALWQKRGVGRWLMLGIVTLLTGFVCFTIIVTQLPPYQGPVTVGKPFPAFKTVRADGTAFTQKDLGNGLTGNGPNTVLVFFRGRW